MNTPVSAASDTGTDDVSGGAEERGRAGPPSLAAWKQFVSVAKPYWLGEERKKAWTLLCC